MSGELTSRLKEVLGLAAEGFSNKEISQRLNITQNTANDHVQHLLVHFGVHKRASLWRHALRLGVIHVSHTPDASLPPLGAEPRRPILVKVNVPADWEKRLDMQWVLEREIHADRWDWTWPEEVKV